MPKIEWKTCIKLGVTAFALFLCIFYWQSGVNSLHLILSASTPLLLGCTIAYIVNILMAFLEDWYSKIIKKGTMAKVQRPICMLFSYLILVALIILIVMIIVPELIGALQVLFTKLPGLLEQLSDNQAFAKYLPEISQKVSDIDWNDMISQVDATIQSNIGAIIEGVVGTAASVFSTAVTGLLAIVFSIYLLAGKETLGRQGVSCIKRYLKPACRDKFLSVLSLLNRSFHSFIVGQCAEAVILGLLCFLGMTILRFPYAPMIGVLVGCTALIPVVGAFIGAAVGFLMVLTVSIQQAFGYLVFILILQQLEGNLIYPRVVGNSIGLPGIWVLTAVTIGGGVGGILGIVFSVPIAATAYQLLREDVHTKSSK